MAEKIKNPRNRNMFIATIVIVILAIMLGLILMSRSQKVNKAPSSAQVATKPNVEVAPGTSTSSEYNKALIKSNEQGASEALDKGKTFVPVLTNESALTNKSPIDSIPPDIKPPPVVEVKVEPPPAVEPPPVIETPPPVVYTPPPVQYVAPKPPKYNDNDAALLALMQGAMAAKMPTHEFNYVGQRENTGKSNSQMNPTGFSGMTDIVTGQGSSMGMSGSMPQGEAIGKAGDVYNAILETGINSDEVSPVLATIVSGPLKGSKLIGSINVTGEKVLVSFSRLSIPSRSTSTNISAVAVDANTSRTALANDVNHHYLQKYGLLLATSFLSGYGQALSRSNTTTIINPNGGATVVSGQLTSKQVNREALGKVGDAVSQTVAENASSIKPTITVPAGAAIGILLMDDLIVK